MAQASALAPVPPMSQHARTVISGSGPIRQTRPSLRAAVISLAKYAPSCSCTKSPSQTWSYWSGRLSLSSSRSAFRTLGNHGLSRQLISQTLAPSGGFALNRSCVADRLLSGFHVTQISEPSSRIVGTSLRQASSLTVSASSTQHSRMRALDLMLSRLCRSPAKV